MTKKANNVAKFQKYNHLENVIPLNFKQEQLLNSLDAGDPIVVAVGSAGTGKTMLSVHRACKEYLNHNIQTIYLTKPAVEVGDSLGFLPGSLTEKYEPYLQPFMGYLNRFLGDAKVKCDMHKNIIPLPLQYIRGMTFDNCILLCDEAQNMTIDELKTLTTRIGENCKIVLLGDPEQSDIKDSCLKWFIEESRRQNLNYEIVEFEDDDCVRSEVAKKFLRFFRSAEYPKQPRSKLWKIEQLLERLIESVEKTKVTNVTNKFSLFK